MGKTCTKCGKDFRDQYALDRHNKRKTPCHAILPTISYEEGKVNCEYCNRQFGSKKTLSFHQENSCRAVPAETVQTELALCRKFRDLGLEIHRLRALMDENRPIDEDLFTFEGPGVLSMSVEDLIRVCEACAEFDEYLCLGEHDRVDLVKGGRLIPAILLAVIRQSRSAPEMQNIRLDPRRQDTVLVFNEERSWERQGLSEVAATLSTAAAKYLHAMGLQHFAGALHGIAGALASIHLMYTQDPGKYQKEVRGLLAPCLRTAGCH